MIITDISTKIKNTLPEMTKSEYGVAVYCLGDMGSIAFDTLDSAAKKTGTSTTSVIRFCRRLGYRGFKEFQDDVRLSFRTMPSLPEKFRRAANIGAPNELLGRIAAQTAECIEKTVGQLSHRSISEAVELLSKSARVFCFGMKESYAMAHYAYTRLLAVRKDVYLLDIAGGEVEAFLNITDKDVVLMFLFHRYTGSAKRMLEIMKKRGIRVVLVTSPPTDEAEKYASVTLPCFVDMGGVKNSSAAPVCLCDYFCNAVAMTGGDEALEHLKASELILCEASVMDD